VKPVKTRATDLEVRAPGDWGRAEKCEPLPVGRQHGVFYSYWKPTALERLLVLFGRPIRLAIVAQRMPPVGVEVSPALEAKLLPAGGGHG
jgi:hypothetical protein